MVLFCFNILFLLIYYSYHHFTLYVFTQLLTYCTFPSLCSPLLEKFKCIASLISLQWNSLSDHLNQVNSISSVKSLIIDWSLSYVPVFMTFIVCTCFWKVPCKQSCIIDIQHVLIVVSHNNSYCNNSFKGDYKKCNISNQKYQVAESNTILYLTHSTWLNALLTRAKEATEFLIPIT